MFDKKHKLTRKEYRALVEEKNSQAGKRSYRNRELEEVQLPLLAYYDSVFKQFYPKSIIRVNPFADIYFKGENIKYMKVAKKKGFLPSEPDVVIIQQTPNKAFVGIAMELKVHDAYIYKKDGMLRKDKHLEAQAKRLDEYREQGFKADFILGIDHCLEVLKMLYAVPIK